MVIGAGNGIKSSNSGQYYHVYFTLMHLKSPSFLLLGMGKINEAFKQTRTVLNSKLWREHGETIAPQF